VAVIDAREAGPFQASGRGRRRIAPKVARPIAAATAKEPAAMRIRRARASTRIAASIAAMARARSSSRGDGATTRSAARRSVASWAQRGCVTIDLASAR
jgi:hypothetical protein